MNYWLFKTEPETFGIEHLKKMPKKTEHWDGVRNYQARNLMRDDMKKGDMGFFYHSNCKVPGIVGTVKIVKESYPDHTAFDPESKYFDPKSTQDKPRWFMVDVKLDQVFSEIISLEAIKQMDGLGDFPLVRKGNRLSVMPVPIQAWNKILNAV